MMSFSQAAARGPARGLLVLAGALALSGCISLFPKTKPVQTYRFGAQESAAVRTAPLAPGAIVVREALLGFARAPAGDQILTSTGEETAFISGGRWTEPAMTLFDDAVSRAFDTRAQASHLLARGEVAPADYSLKLDVRVFEARYEHGPGAPPTIVVELYAGLNNHKDPTLDRDALFQARVPTSDNRIGAISAGFDAAVDKVLADLVAWVDRKGDAA